VQKLFNFTAAEGAQYSEAELKLQDWPVHVRLDRDIIDEVTITGILKDRDLKPPFRLKEGESFHSTSHSICQLLLFPELPPTSPDTMIPRFFDRGAFIRAPMRPGVPGLHTHIQSGFPLIFISPSHRKRGGSF